MKEIVVFMGDNLLITSQGYWVFNPKRKIKYSDEIYIVINKINVR